MRQIGFASGGLPFKGGAQPRKEVVALSYRNGISGFSVRLRYLDGCSGVSPWDTRDSYGPYAQPGFGGGGLGFLVVGGVVWVLVWGFFVNRGSRLLEGGGSKREGGCRGCRHNKSQSFRKAKIKRGRISSKAFKISDRGERRCPTRKRSSFHTLALWNGRQREAGQWKNWWPCWLQGYSSEGGNIYRNKGGGDLP